MSLRLAAHLPGDPMRSGLFIAVFLPFLVPLLYAFRFHAFESQPAWLFTVLGLLLLGLLMAVVVTGLIRRFPVWALPSIGMVFFFFYAILQLFAQDAVFSYILLPRYGGWPIDHGYSIIENIKVMLVAQELLLVAMLVAIAVLLRVAPGFHARVRQEWTLLSFVLYGMAILPIIGNDEYHGIEGYEIASALILAAGAGLYLIASRRWLRVMVLFIPAILSPLLMSLGLYQAYPMQSWSNLGNHTFRVWEALQPLLYLSPLPFLLLLAALSPRLPWGTGRKPLVPKGDIKSQSQQDHPQLPNDHAGDSIVQT